MGWYGFLKNRTSLFPAALTQCGTALALDQRLAQIIKLF
ncbi:hypothetical protein AQ1_02739 [alpha proteobacterium Q-1]|nr:hypothetical protein AQ1_02739 [alpha proteobacterium Q-1]